MKVFFFFLNVIKLLKAHRVKCAMEFESTHWMVKITPLTFSKTNFLLLRLYIIQIAVYRAFTGLCLGMLYLPIPLNFPKVHSMLCTEPKLTKNGMLSLTSYKYAQDNT